MFTTNIEHLKRQMNEAGAKRTPFLFAVNFELTEGFFVKHPLQQSEILFQVKGKGNKPVGPSPHKRGKLTPLPIPYPSYQKAFNCLSQGFQRGDSFLANLTLQTPIETNLSLQEIFSYSESPYQLLVPHRFVCFSPERFVAIDKNGRISTNPMKGTIDASLPNAEEQILNDKKETAEHATIVDLLRNDLGRVANKIQVDQYRYIDKIETQERSILQVSSEISGQLPADFYANMGDILFDLLPAGSISGAPKQATVQLIQLAEQKDRGFYSGVFGYFDGEELDAAVLIRYIEKEGNNYFFRSGGGITAYSNCLSEYNEILEKIYLPFV